MRYATIRSKKDIVALVVVGTALAFFATSFLTFQVIGVERTSRVHLATVICPLVIAPLMLGYLGKTMWNGTQLRNQLRDALQQDHLTGIYNRKYFFERIAALPLETQASILMIDIDFFKSVNDTYGHFAGDEVIRRVAQTLAGTVRQTDFVARFGGEEFIAYLEGNDQKGALAIAERFRTAVEVLNISTADGDIRVTVSIGLGIAQTNEDIGNVVEEADTALLFAKASGRNRVVLAASIKGNRAA